jgi:RNA polymerase sigma-70 factor (ECF subfamily)
MTDAALVRRVLAGDGGAYGILVDRHYERCARYAQHMLGNREDAEEAVQDAFVRAYRALGRYEEQERFGAWVMRIVVNRCRTAGARRQRRERVFAPLDEMTVQVERATGNGSGGSDADGVAWREEIERALTQLAPEQREAFLLKHVEELSYEEMAEITGAGISALKMRVKRACERLRELLEEVHDA